MSNPAPALSAHLRDQPEALQQSHLWFDAISAMGAPARIETVADRPVLTLRKSLPLIGGLGLISRAPLDLTPDAARSLRQNLGVRHLAINAEGTSDATALARAGFHCIAAPRMVAELALLPSPDAMARRLAPKWRNRLRHGQNAGLVITRCAMPAEPKHWLLRAEKRQSARLWYHPLPPEMIAALADARPGAAQLFTAHHLGQRVAAMLFFRHGRSATYQIGWTSQEGRQRSAGPALMWRAMVELQAMGTDWIDLGAADPLSAAGLARFKCGTGARLRSLGGTWVDTAWARRRSSGLRTLSKFDLHKTVP